MKPTDKRPPPSGWVESQIPHSLQGERLSNFHYDPEGRDEAVWVNWNKYDGSYDVVMKIRAIEQQAVNHQRGIEGFLYEKFLNLLYKAGSQRHCQIDMHRSAAVQKWHEMEEKRIQKLYDAEHGLTLCPEAGNLTLTNEGGLEVCDEP